MEPVSPVVFETERLYAREFVRADAAAVSEYAGSIENSGFMPWSPESPEEAEGFICSRLAAQIESPRRVYDFALCIRETDEFIGSIGLYLDKELKQADMGYILNMKHWGKGYAAEAAKALMAFGFFGLDLHRITARCDDKNAASYRVMEKCGMRREAHFIKDEYVSCFGKKSWRSHYHYAILQKEFLCSMPDGDYSARGNF